MPVQHNMPCLIKYFPPQLKYLVLLGLQIPLAFYLTRRGRGLSAPPSPLPLPPPPRGGTPPGAIECNIPARNLLIIF